MRLSGTTLAAIAAEAGTAVETIYSGFASKRGVLLAAIDVAFLETDVARNVIIYQRFGFEVVQSEVIVGVNTQFMWRPAVPPHG